jgi:hypothetical protein
MAAISCQRSAGARGTQDWQGLDPFSGPVKAYFPRPIKLLIKAFIRNQSGGWAGGFINKMAACSAYGGLRPQPNAYNDWD